MAEGRMLKKKVSLNEALANLDNDTHRLLFTWAIPHLDIEGRISGSPRVFKATVAPLLDHLTPEKITKFFNNAHEKGLIIRYKIDREWWIEYPKFKENQNLRESREASSKIPPPPENSGTTPGVIQEESSRTPAEVKGREVKGREEKASPPKGNGDGRPAFSCPYFELSQVFIDELLKDYPGIDSPELFRQLVRMKDYISDNPRKYKRKPDGQLSSAKGFIRNWIERMEIKPEIPKLIPAVKKKHDPQCPKCHGKGLYQSGEMPDHSPAYKPCLCEMNDGPTKTPGT